MHLDFMTPEVWNGLVLGVVVIGLALAALRLYRDLSRPRDEESSPVDQPPPPAEDARRPRSRRR